MIAPILLLATQDFVESGDLTTFRRILREVRHAVDLENATDRALYGIVASELALFDDGVVSIAELRQRLLPLASAQPGFTVSGPAAPFAGHTQTIQRAFVPERRTISISYSEVQHGAALPA